jgi:Cu-Zn family superoxide dismutase
MEFPMRRSQLALLIPALLVLAACGTAPEPRTAPAPAVPVVSTAKLAEAALAPASASIVSGRLALVPDARGVHITGTIGGLQPMQTAAFHVHERGDCSAVDASSAGPHFNPANQPHGRNGAGAHHAGDMDNLRADAQGRVSVDVRLPGVTLGGGAATDIIGRALVVHANADDYRSQPAGNAGARIACGVIRVPR